MKSIVTVIAIAAAAFAPSAFAQTSSNSDSGYFGVELGYATIKDGSSDTVRLATKTLGGTATATQSKDVTVYRGFAGFNLNENFALELGFLTTSDATASLAGTTSGAVAYTANVSAQFAGFDYSVVMRPSASSGLGGLFFKYGGHSLTAKYSVNASAGGAAANGSDSDVGPGMMAGIGYDYKISDKGFVRFSYTRMDKISGWDESTDVLSVGYQKRF